MKLLKNLVIFMSVLVLGTCSSAMALDSSKKTSGFNVAIVDVMQVVQKSPQINALNVERKNKLDDLGKFVENARKDVASQKSDDAKKTLENKYNKELNERKDAIDTDFSKKLADIDKDITSLIKVKAKKMGYDLVLTKNNVLYGADDITSDIIKELK